jgi:hypothetical protein
MAEEGLRSLAISDADIRCYLGVIEGRCRNKQNGANWQRSFVKKNAVGMEDMLEAYLLRQETAIPVHEWTL